MSDLIDRQAAIDAIKNADVCMAWHGDISAEDAADIAVRATKRSVVDSIEDMPSVQPLVIHCSDCEDWLERQSILGLTISELPSAQPEIIRCRDCEYGKQDEYGRWYCRDLGCQIGDEDGSGFCANAERRTDEQT